MSYTILSLPVHTHIHRLMEASNITAAASLGCNDSGKAAIQSISSGCLTDKSKCLTQGHDRDRQSGLKLANQQFKDEPLHPEP